MFYYGFPGIKKIKKRTLFPRGSFDCEITLENEDPINAYLCIPR